MTGGYIEKTIASDDLTFDNIYLDVGVYPHYVGINLSLIYFGQQGT